MRRPKIKEILNGNFTPKAPEKNKKLMEAIKTVGYSQRLVAYMADIDYGRLNSIVNGWVKPNLIERQVISRVLRQPSDELFNTDEKK